MLGVTSPAQKTSLRASYPINQDILGFQYFSSDRSTDEFEYEEVSAPIDSVTVRIYSPQSHSRFLTVSCLQEVQFGANYTDDVE